MKRHENVKRKMRNCE